MITTIFYDWGGVLIEQGPEGVHRYWADALGVTVADLRTSVQLFLPRFLLGLTSEPDFWDEVCASLTVPAPSRPLWQAAFRHSYVEHNEVLNFARELRDAGYGIGLISNTERPIAELFIEKMAVDTRYAAFENPVFSCTVGRAKPDTAIFREAMERHGTDAARSVFLDDSEENTRAAIGLGMHAIHVTDPLKSVEELRALLSASATA